MCLLLSLPSRFQPYLFQVTSPIEVNPEHRGQCRTTCEVGKKRNFELLVGSMANLLSIFKLFSNTTDIPHTHNNELMFGYPSNSLLPMMEHDGYTSRFTILSTEGMFLTSITTD
jgi:hypothetical protein